jgi:hypothetical protein
MSLFLDVLCLARTCLFCGIVPLAFCKVLYVSISLVMTLLLKQLMKFISYPIREIFRLQAKR